jgi:hypothetical protein
MKCRDVEYLLVELADGTLNSEEKTRVEEHLVHCEECAMNAAMLADTFALLRAEIQEPPPEHYFSVLLPKIRKRLETKERAWGYFFPAWLARAAAPITVSALALTVVVLFRAFEPSEEFSPLKNIVEQVPGDEIATLVVTPTEPFSGEYGLPSSDKLLEAMPNPNNFVEKMKSELLADDLPIQQLDAGSLPDEKVLDDMDDDAVSQVLDRLNEHTSL